MALNKLYTVKEAAEYMGVTPGTVYKWIKEGSITGQRRKSKIQGQLRFTEEDLKNCMEDTNGISENDNQESTPSEDSRDTGN